jgi:tyrosyl-tRNA synthetase
MKLWDILRELNVFPAHGEARRLFSQGGVRVDDEVVCDMDAVIGDGFHWVQIGKRKVYWINVFGDKYKAISLYD